MVQDNLHDPSSVTPTGIACIWRALEAPSALPINYVCRLLAQAGLIPRLFAVVRQAVSLQARAAAAGPAAGGGVAPGAAGLAGPRAGGSSGSLLTKAWGGDEDGRSPLATKEGGGLAGGCGVGTSEPVRAAPWRSSAQAAG
jgi:hypothetical protein